jgi:hypothetical protein
LIVAKLIVFLIGLRANLFDFKKVIDFTDRVFKLKNHSQAIKKLATQYLDTSLKMDQLSQYLLTLK